ncbi:unnamed protein product [Euphydryas editha]|uniref:Uncharacterized protein n=1 Tax=Euphydryas editha TaxID=104508 RepID=A0AAU9V9M1_EUPED|nr:unnamed protein product [Euphydryas editha]
MNRTFKGVQPEVEDEIKKLKRDIVDLSEVRREGEDTITLKSGKVVYYREGDQQSQGDVGFMVRSFLIDYLDGVKMNMDKMKIMSNIHVVPTPITVGNSTLELVDEYIYLGQKEDITSRERSIVEYS